MQWRGGLMFEQIIEYEVDVDEYGFFECPQCGEQVNINDINKHECKSIIDWDAGEWSLILED
jgi:hypothetical protein